MAPKDELLGKGMRQQQRGTDDQSEEMPSHSKALHGMYHRQIVEMADIRKSYQWLKKAGLTDSTESLILAAQEQALGTRSRPDSPTHSGRMQNAGRNSKH